MGFLLVGDGEILAGEFLVSTADRIGNLLVLRLLEGGLVLLRPCFEDVLLEEVNGWLNHGKVSKTKQRSGEDKIMHLTFVESI